MPSPFAGFFSGFVPFSSFAGFFSGFVPFSSFGDFSGFEPCESFFPLSPFCVPSALSSFFGAVVAGGVVSGADSEVAGALGEAGVDGVTRGVRRVGLGVVAAGDGVLTCDDGASGESVPMSAPTRNAPTGSATISAATARTMRDMSPSCPAEPRESLPG